MLKIKIETTEEQIIEGYKATFADINKIARMNCVGLTYLMNVMDNNNPSNDVYMWFVDDNTDENYLIKI